MCLNLQVSEEKWETVKNDLLNCNYPDKILLESDNRHLKLAEIQLEVEKKCEEFKALGFQKGHLVIGQVPSNEEFIFTLLAVQQLEGIFLPIRVDFTRVQAEKIQTQTSCKLFLQKDGLPISFNKAKRYSQSGVAFLTSGTTAESKIILHSWENLIKNAKNAGDVQQINENSIVLNTLPLCHSGGLGMQAIAALTRGAHLILSTKFPLKILINEKNISHTIFVPSHLKLIKSYFGKFKIPHVLTGSVPVKTQVLESLKLFGDQIYSVYGLTESGPFVSYFINDEKFKEGTLSYLGSPLPEFTLSNTDSGELCIESPLNGQILKDENFIPIKKLETGDKIIIEDNDLFFEARLKNIINYGGLKINALEIENALLEISFIKDAAIVGVEDSIYGEIVKAFVVTNKQDKLKIKNELLKTLAEFQIPKEFSFVEEIPKTIIGKTKHSALK